MSQQKKPQKVSKDRYRRSGQEEVPVEPKAEADATQREDPEAPESIEAVESAPTQEEALPMVNRPSQEVLGRLVCYWQKALAQCTKAQEYLKARGLWARELLLALFIGYASGKLPQVLPKDGKIRRQLIRMGILNKKGNEFFYRRIVVPIFDENGVLVNVYGRALDPDNETPHLYLPGPRRGVFNLVGIREAPTVILTESILDALSLMVLGFANTTASYGVKGFTADHRAALIRAKTKRVYCAYDADPVGDHAADQLAHDLANHGIEVLRVELPCKDPNDFLKGGGTKETFQSLLDQARPFIAPAPSPAPVATPAPVPPEAITQPSPERGVTPAGSTSRGAFSVRLGERTYEVLPLPCTETAGLKVRLKVRHEGRPFIDTINLYSDRARLVAVPRLAKVFGAGTTREQIEADLYSLAEEVEARLRNQHDADSSPLDSMSDTDRHAALDLLKALNLAERIQNDLAELGVVGEDLTKLLVYLVAISRNMDEPLSLVVVSRSSAGKSYLVLKTCELMPPEDHLAYTRLSPKALFHDESDRLKNKLLSIEEATGMEEASYAVRVMQSNQMLRNLTTITDPVTGRHRAQENVVYGPVALIVTTTQELDFETVSRAFVASVDESVQQTERIHQMQRLARTRDGLSCRLKNEAIVNTHRNAQRLLKRLRVVNNHAPRLTFPSGTLRLRREHKKYLILIEAITFLFQYQRKQGVHQQNGQSVPYVETSPEDVDLANLLVVTSLRQAFEEINESSRDLLATIRKMVGEREELSPTADGRFSRRDLREYTGWSDRAVRDHLKQLEEMEYVAVVSGSFGKQYVYTLGPDHRLAVCGSASIEEEIRALGLTGSKELKQIACRGPKR